MRLIARHRRTATVIAWSLFAAGLGLWIFGVVERVPGLPVLATGLAFAGAWVGAKVIEAGRR